MTSKPAKNNEYKTKYCFFLNPYRDAGFTKCPKCESKTKVRKFPLVIHVEPGQIAILNKTCRYCDNCDLIIAKQAELEASLAASLEKVNPEVIGNEYITMGVVNRKYGRALNKGKITTKDILNRLFIFEEELDFEVLPGGWYLPEDSA